MGVLAPPALIPVRLGPTAKRRLAHVLDAGRRAELVRGLLDHVIDVLMQVGSRIVVLTPEATDVAGADVWVDQAPGLNAAVAAAVDVLGAPVLVVHADLPLLAPADVDAVISDGADVVIARSYDGGTNGLLLRSSLRPAFGAGSALMHSRRARGAGLVASVLDVPGFAIDVDDEVGLSACGTVRAFPHTRP